MNVIRNVNKPFDFLIKGKKNKLRFTIESEIIKLEELIYATNKTKDLNNILTILIKLNNN